MSAHTIVAATVSHHHQPHSSSPFYSEPISHPPGPSRSRPISKDYGATASSDRNGYIKVSQLEDLGGDRGIEEVYTDDGEVTPRPEAPRSMKQNGQEDGQMEDGYDEEEDEDEDMDGEMIVDVTWRYLSRLYALIPIVTLLFLASLILLITFAWPPSKEEKKAGQTYPHPFFWKAFLIGIFASFTIQSLRVPSWVVVSWFGLNNTVTNFLATSLLTALHELARLASIPLIAPSPTSGFHSSYYLGLGWGAAEAAWGIVQGWEQLAMYEDVMQPSRAEQDAESGWWRLASGFSSVVAPGGLAVVREDDEDSLSEDGEDRDVDEERGRMEDEAELERKVAVLERMRARRELEEVIGLPYPNIPFALHLLWRLDTLLLNLGLTLILSSFYYDSTPLYHHIASSMSYTPPLGPVPDPGVGDGGSGSSNNKTISLPGDAASPWLPLVWVLVFVFHLTLSLVWKVVGRVGVGAVTWGGLIVSLGSVFAGLGAWGGLV